MPSARHSGALAARRRSRFRSWCRPQAAIEGLAPIARFFRHRNAILRPRGFEALSRLFYDVDFWQGNLFGALAPIARCELVELSAALNKR